MPRSRNRKGRKAHNVSGGSMSGSIGKDHSFSMGLIYGKGYPGHRSSVPPAKRYKRPKI